jgi:hypothetical protein
MSEQAMRAEMTIDDAINVVNVVNDCLAHDEDEDVRELAAGAKRLVKHIDKLSLELERERARRRGLTAGEVRLVDGHLLVEGADGGGRRDFLAGRAVHAGQTLYLLTSLGWYPVRYESNMPRKTSLLYLSLPGVREDAVITVPHEARLAWPEELQRT